jgi:PKD repeat protein
MKTTLLLTLSLLIAMGISAQTTVFSDNFESGTTAWTLTQNWGTATSNYYSSNHSLTESPVGNYTDNQSSTATMASGVNLSTALSAELSFWAIYNIEGGFDYMYVEVSGNGGSSWITIDSFDDTSSVWTKYTYSLGGYVGQSNVKVRFRFFSDGAVNYDGMYIDDFSIVSYTVDNSPPLIIHQPRAFHEGRLNADSIIANIIDISGVAEAKVIYAVDGGTNDTILANSVNANTYYFLIPAQTPGASVDYHIYASDSTSSGNPTNTATYNYIAGEHIFYDNGQVDFVDSIGVGSGAAMRMTIAGPTTISAVLLRNYTDPNRPNDSILVHVWSSVLGAPGTDLITPVKVYPSATLQQTSAMTIVDLRPYASQLSNLTGDIFIGYTVSSGSAWATITQPSSVGRSYKYSATGWTQATGTSGTSDFHFRVVTTGQAMPPTINFNFDTSQDPMVSFTNTTVDADSYRWNFGDGSPFDTATNPTHTYTSNGQFLVCLKATNANGSDSLCKHVVISGNPAPVSDFTFDISADPTVQFTDASTGNPTSWYWDFDDNSTTSTQQSPSHTFPAVGGTFNVCMTASNSNGNGNNICKNVVLSVGAGLNEHGNPNEIKIYPNPVSDEAVIQLFKNNSGQIRLEVYDISGKKIQINYSRNANGIILKKGNLSTGHYLFRILADNDAIYTGSLIIR